MRRLRFDQARDKLVVERKFVGMCRHGAYVTAIWCVQGSDCPQAVALIDALEGVSQISADTIRDTSVLRAKIKAELGAEARIRTNP